MSSVLDKMNLRPGERRLVVVVAIVVLAVLYFMFVYPQFGEWKKLQQRKTDIAMALNRYQTEINKTSAYKAQQTELEKKGGKVDPELQSLDLIRVVQNLATANGVSLGSISPGKGDSGSGKTNQFFEEKTVNIQYNAEEAALVNFLYSLSSGESLIRVSSMTINPDQPQQRLIGSATLIASYPRKPPARPVAAAPAARPAGASAQGPKTISAAVTASQKIGATNAPAKPSLWSKVTGWFSSAPKTNAPAKKPAATNAPPAAPASATSAKKP